jgi:fructose transport system substrate-binding protein
MASLGVDAIASGEIPPNSEGIDFFNTGVELITDGAGGPDSQTSDWGLDNCWGGDPGTGDAGDAAEEGAIVGLITKNNTNPFFVKMAEGAQAAADEAGVELRTFAGEDDSDNDAQVRAIEDLISLGAAGFMITASDTTAIVPTIEKAKEAGLIVIALDTPLDPIDAATATFATDNFRAGELIGEWALAQVDDPDSAKIALLNINASQPTVGVLRNQGFMQGFGIDLGDPSKWGDEDDPRIVGHDITEGSIEGGRTAMENLLALDPDINVVYTLNEPAAAGARLAMEAAGRSIDSYVLVSVDGSCAGVRDIADGNLGATSMQFPLLMASLGVDAIASGEIPPNSEGIDFFNTGVELITDGAGGPDSQTSDWGLDNCWG